jgi:hypothetical protein
MSESPAAVVFDGKLYCFHEGVHEDFGMDPYLWYNVFDGNAWQGDTQVPGSIVLYSSPCAVSTDLPAPLAG